MMMYQGQEYPLKVGGLRAGATAGITSVDVIGEVYNLTHLEDIEGTYTSGSAGATVAGGASITELKNKKGVVIKARGRQIGVALSLDVGEVSIKLKN
jgi:hypothetical protein